MHIDGLWETRDHVVVVRQREILIVLLFFSTVIFKSQIKKEVNNPSVKRERNVFKVLKAGLKVECQIVFLHYCAKLFQEIITFEDSLLLFGYDRQTTQNCHYVCISSSKSHIETKNKCMHLFSSLPVFLCQTHGPNSQTTTSCIPKANGLTLTSSGTR